MPMIAAYVRVSSKAQTLKTQRDAITRAARTRGVLIAEWYAERVSSQNDRPELTRLRKDVRAGKISKLYVYRLDRISRGGICETVNLISEFKLAGCKVETIADGFSFEGPASDVVLAVLAWAAEMERAVIRERIAAARVRVEASGGAWGRPRVRDERVERKIHALHKDGSGLSIRQIAMSLKIPKSSVALVLSRKPTPKRSVQIVTKKR
jgi:DNA invertase Pin-like site-specific DNA recombinase